MDRWEVWCGPADATSGGFCSNGIPVGESATGLPEFASSFSQIILQPGAPVPADYEGLWMGLGRNGLPVMAVLRGDNTASMPGDTGTVDVYQRDASHIPRCI